MRKSKIENFKIPIDKNTSLCYTNDRPEGRKRNFENFESEVIKMTKREIINEIAGLLCTTDQMLRSGKMTPLQHTEQIRNIYNNYKPDVSVWAAACKIRALKLDGRYLPMG